MSSSTQPSLVHWQRLCQHEGRPCPSAHPSGPEGEAALCSLLSLSFSSAAPSPPKEQKHFDHSPLKREKDFHYCQFTSWKRLETLNFRYLLSNKFLQFIIQITRKTKIPLTGVASHFERKTPIKKILGSSRHASHPHRNKVCLWPNRQK